MVCNLLTPLFVVLIVGVAPALAQPGPDRSRIANDSMVCLDRCDAGFAQCLGSNSPRGPLTPIRPPDNGSVPTPPPFEQCLLDRDICAAQCQLSQAEARKRAARR
jgi:hypothetical protein